MTLLPAIGARVWHPDMGPGEVRAIVKQQGAVFVLWDCGEECLTPGVNVRVGSVPKAEMARYLGVIEPGGRAWAANDGGAT